MTTQAREPEAAVTPADHLPSPRQQDTSALTTGDLLDLPAVVDVETAGRAFGIGRTAAYLLAKRGEFPCKVVRAGRAYRVVTADLRRVLLVDEAPARA